MKFTDLEDTNDFHRNMRKTPWTRLFPHWWDEKDALLNAIGDEIERIKATAIFGLLNIGIKPPVMIWQESLKNDIYNVNEDITQLPSTIEIRAPLYKTWGDITLTNNTSDDIDGIEITFNGTDGFAINQLISQNDIIKINLTENKVQINGHTIKPQVIGKGMPYFITSQNNEVYKEGTPLHNEIIRLKINTDTNLENTIITDTIDVTEKLENWIIDGDATIYNHQGADPWIQINNGNIKYDLDYTNISNISFWYKGDDSKFMCCANSDIVQSTHSENIKINHIIDGEYGRYEFNIEDINNKVITDALIDKKLKIKLSNTTFNTDTYILHLPILNNNNNIVDTLEIKLLLNEWVEIPITKLTNYIIGHNAQILIYHSTPTIRKNTNNQWSNYIIKTDNLTNPGTLEFYNLGDNPIYINDIKYTKTNIYNTKCDINVDVNMHDAVFINEQNIEVTGLELIPIERVELYAKYDFKYNSERNGWQKVYQKKYDSNTNVLYDMITTHFFTKEFYVEVWFKTLQYPYQVGFPCTQDASLDSMFHVNNRLDTWGEQLGLERRLYKKNINEKDYARTLPTYYPFDIEQDYWYFKRLTSEYAWNDLAINDVDIKDTDGNNLFKLYSISPFCDDFVVHAKSSYPVDKEFTDYNEYYPVLIMQQNTEGYMSQSSYNNIINLLGHNDFTSNILLNNKTDNNDVIYKMRDHTISDKDYTIKNDTNTFGHISKELLTFFDLTTLPEDVDIDDITITIEAESTDNKTNKFSNDKTGLIIKDLKDNEYFIPLTANKSYQLSKQSINYSISSSDILKTITENSIDEVITQKAQIGQFEGRIGEFVKIPFTLKEDEIDVTDITDIWVYFNDTLKSAEIIKENNKQYIYVYIPNQAVITEMRIVCNSNTKMPFTTTVDVAKMNKYSDENEVEYQYLTGPLVDGEAVDIVIEEEWHTKDLRNILQRQGIYFRNVFQNDDYQSTTNIILYNIKLSVHYSPKKSDFKFKTHINTKDAVKPTIGLYEIDFHNTGDKPLKTSIDIITPPNIKLDTNYIDIDLNIGGGFSKSIEIIPEYPIIDGFYDILAFCDNVIKRDSISVFSDSLIRTGVTIEPHYGKYYENITLSATVNTVDGTRIHSGANRVQFYINGYAVGSPVIVYNNKAETTIIPSDYNFTGTGNLKLEARYLGNTKYASSRGYSTIFISKNSTRITIVAPEKAVYNNAYEAKAVVEYFDGEEYKPVNDGYVTFYINDEILSNSTNSNYTNGYFIASLGRLENPPGEYILKARYEGSNNFASIEGTQDFEIIGGDVTIFTFNEEVKPNQKINLKAKVVDKNKKAIPYGYLDFISDDLNIEYLNMAIDDGIASTPEFIINAELDDDEDTEIYPVRVIYHGALNDNEHIYNDGEEVGYLTIRKSEVIIEYSNLYQASQYEPLGFLIKVKDAETNEYLSSGQVKVTLPGQRDLEIIGNIDEDGVARIVYNLINFSAKEWHDLLKWSFSTNNDNSLGQIDIINNPNIPDYDGPYDSDYLYKIYDGDYSDITLVDFELSSDGNYLEYVGHKNDGQDETERDISDFIFIDEDGCLYARTDIDEIRQYVTGLQNIKIDFISSGGYKGQTINVENGLNIEVQNVDLDIHSYDLTYIDTDPIICYVTKYDSEEVNIPVNEGSVCFIFDDKIIDTVNVVDGTATLSNELLTNISAGNHLLEVDYIKNNINTTRSYSLFNLKQASPILTIDTDRIARNKNTQITVTVSSHTNLNVSLNGTVTLYLNDKKIGEQYLYGNEKLTGVVQHDGTITNDMYIGNISAIFNYVMPNDIDIPGKYTLKAVYEGNEFFAPSEPAIKSIQEEPSPVIISSDDINMANIIGVAVNEECSIDFNITCADDIIDEGVLSLLDGNNDIVASGHVMGNVATLTWTPTEIKEYNFILKYSDAIHYQDNVNNVIKFNSRQPFNEIVLPNIQYSTIKQALMSLTSNGTLYIVDDIYLNKPLNINKKCNIIGDNDVSLINTLNDKNTITINDNVHIDNIHFISNNYPIQIINNDYLVIYHSILDKNIQLHNNKTLLAQRNFIYGTFYGEPADLNNNWWGTNTPPYNVDSHIILEVESINKPAVISEEVDIVGKMVSSNGREYIIPEANFIFGADSGYFSTDFGKTINHEAKTTYFDAEKEGYIYFTVDNETVKYPVYEYERKTELILDDIHEIPLNYQVPIKVKVQSAADIFYEFDESNNVTKSTTTINQGHVLFYIDDQQVGYCPVKNGEAETVIFFTDKYYINPIYTLKAIYKPNNYYFTSETSKTIKLINDNDICYVSALGNDADNGSYGQPFKTIQHAIDLNKSTIYLLDNEWNENNINVTHNTIIKSFKNHTIFNDLNGECIFDIKENILLKLQDIDFVNNQVNVLFNNKGTLNIEKCIISNNKKIFNNTNEINVIYSAIVDNNIISDNIDPLWFTYCWFGENNPDIDGINNHIQMSEEISKDILYIGGLTHITGILNTYKNGRLIYQLDKELPLRIAKFATTYGSMKPVKDYTYNNKSTSLLNTQEDNNTNKYVVSIPENTNYIEHKIYLECNVTDVYDNAASGIVSMSVSGDNTNIQQNITLNDGKAILEINRLSIGTYTLKCSYIKDEQIYTATRKFIVKKPDIIVKKFEIQSQDNLYYTIVDIELEDNFGNKIENEVFNIKIDNELIGRVKSDNGIIYEKISYDKKENGQYTLSIDNIGNDSEYDTFTYDKPLNINKKDVKILFDYSSFEVNVRNNIDINIVDNEGNNVEGGYIKVELNNEVILSNVEVINGNVHINNFIIDEIGQHTIVIYYSGLEGYYNDALYIDSCISVGIFNVIFGINKNEYITADIGKPLNFSTSVIDAGKQLVNHGYVNCYINDILLNENPISIKNGILDIKNELPQDIISGVYTFKLEYIDVTNTYLDTYLSTFLEVGKIPTNINMDIIYGAPGQNTTLDYQISTIYGSASTGTLVAKYDNIIIGTSTVTDSITNQITIKVPFVPDTQDYDIIFEYTDENIYADSQLSNRLVIQKNTVDIEPSHTWYYPDTLFHFVGTIRDQDGNRVNTGKATLYIDNVQETEFIDVVNGQFTIPLSFNKAREYPMTIVYEENNYYSYSDCKFVFTISNIDIQNISLVDDNSHIPNYYIENDVLYSLPNQKVYTELNFDTLDNYNVKDGVIDIKIDNNTINSYYIAENNKYISIDIGSIQKGEHTLDINYHGSALFNDILITKTLMILSKQLELKINNNETIIANNHKDTINIETMLYEPNTDNPIIISGIIRYYIGLPIYTADPVGNTIIADYDYRLIDIQQIENESHSISKYKLPTSLLEYAIDKYETHYKIKAEFIGNDEYDSSETSVDLYIEKQNCNLEIAHNNDFIDANYRDTIDINFNIEAEGNPLVNFYIDDDLIGSAIAHNNTGTLSYKLDSKYTVKEGNDYYTLRASFDGSAVDNPAEDAVQMHIHPLMPRLNTSDIEAFYGGIIKPPTTLIDIDGAIINDGVLVYNITEDEEYRVLLNKTVNIPIPLTTEENITLHVKYETDNANYMVFEDDINILLKPNDVVLDIEAPDFIYRGEEYNITINATSKSSLPIDIVFNQEYQMENNSVDIPIIAPLAQAYQDSIAFTITSPGNQFFNQVYEQIQIPVKNHDIVTLDYTTAKSGTNAHTLTDAIDLVAKYGTIKVINAPDNEDVIINKSLSLMREGENALSNWHIVNNTDEVLIKGFKFDNNQSNVINNYGELIVSECTFSNGNNSAIYNDSNILIDKCIFNNNHAEYGAGVQVSSKNHRSIISNCKFTQNSVSGNGTCIYLNKANDIEISNNVFANNTDENNVASCIYIYGNADVSSNIFYNNTYDSEINVISDGNLSMQNNIFDGAIQSVKSYNGNIDADYNYWGYNDIEDIENNNSDRIIFNNWLISDRKDYNKKINNEDVSIIVGVIDKYVNRFEQEITTIIPIDKKFPVMVGANRFNLNDEIQGNPSAIIKIGQQELHKVNE